MSQHSLHPMPHELLREGIKIFGSKVALAESVSQIETFDFPGLKQPMRLAAFTGDKTLVRIRKEIIQDSYNLRGVSTGKGLVLDIGANIGDVTVYLAMRLKHARIVAVEAVPHTAWLVRYNLMLNNIIDVPCESLGSTGGTGATRNSVCVLNRAVTRNGGGGVPISFSLNRTQSATVGAEAAQGMATVVPMVSCNELLQYRHDKLNPSSLLPVLLFKMDCEGCEFEVIPSMGSVFADRNVIHKFAGEIHMSVAYGNNKPTFAPKRSKTETEALLSQLASRGCEAPKKNKNPAIHC